MSFSNDNFYVLKAESDVFLSLHLYEDSDILNGVGVDISHRDNMHVSFQVSTLGGSGGSRRLA